MKLKEIRRVRAFSWRLALGSCDSELENVFQPNLISVKDGKLVPWASETLAFVPQDKRAGREDRSRVEPHVVFWVRSHSARFDHAIVGHGLVSFAAVRNFLPDYEKS